LSSMTRASRAAPAQLGGGFSLDQQEKSMTSYFATVTSASRRQSPP
jgi:hypothetical protein